MKLRQTAATEQKQGQPFQNRPLKQRRKIFWHKQSDICILCVFTLDLCKHTMCLFSLFASLYPTTGHWRPAHQFRQQKQQESNRNHVAGIKCETHRLFRGVCLSSKTSDESPQAPVGLFNVRLQLRCESKTNRKDVNCVFVKWSNLAYINGLYIQTQQVHTVVMSQSVYWWKV